MTSPRSTGKSQRRRVPRSTLFAIFGAVVFGRQAFFVPDPNPTLILAGLFLMGAIPVEFVERAIRGSVLAAPLPEDEAKPPSAADKGSPP